MSAEHFPRLVAKSRLGPAIAKTITYRSIATIVDFTTSDVVMGREAGAMIPSATGFFLGPSSIDP